MSGLLSCGNATLWGDAGAFCACLMKADELHELHAEALLTAQAACGQIEKELDLWESIDPEKVRQNARLPGGLYTGLGGLFSACRTMASADVPGAHALCGKLLHYIVQSEAYRCPGITAAESAAGLMLALAGMKPAKHPKAEQVLRACAEQLLAGPWPGRADLPYGCAGIGAALAAAYLAVKDTRYAEGALAAFRTVQKAYSPPHNSLPNEKAGRKPAGSGGPHPAGIYLAASGAAEYLNSFSRAAEVLTILRQAALDRLANRQTLLHRDSLNEGNAISVLALLHAGKTESAGRILNTMLERKKRNGTFILAPAGVRSTFNPSLRLGTHGIGLALLKALKTMP